MPTRNAVDMLPTSYRERAATMARQGTELHVTIYYVTRKKLSTMGNPTKVLHTSEGSYTTETNGSIGYGLSDNLRDREATLKLTRAGRVWDVVLDGNDS